MRGGLGRTLLTAFLLLSIVPLSLISFVASNQARRNLQRELEEKLVTVATLTESQIHGWIASQQLLLALLSNSLAIEPQDDNNAAVTSLDANPTRRPGPVEGPAARDPTELGQTRALAHLHKVITEIQAENSALAAVLLFDQQGQVLAAHPPLLDSHPLHDLLEGQPMPLEAQSRIIQAQATSSSQTWSSALVLAQSASEGDLTLVALFDPRSLIQAVTTADAWDKDGEIYLVPLAGPALALGATAATSSSDGREPITERQSVAIQAALAGQTGAGSYENYRGVTVIGAYRWLPELNAALLVEQPRQSALAASDDLAVVLIGATLAMALLTALIAAAVTRRITLPIVQLTATAVQIAAGDLDQKVPATRRDEIGILARAFNVMTSKLQILYQDLEAKVRERTAQLQKANAEIRYRAMQLAISAEVARVVTSILDREALLARVVELIRDCFQAYFVAIFFIDECDNWAILHAGSGGLGRKLRAQGYRVDLKQKSPISQAVNSLEPCVCAGPTLDGCTDRATFPYTRAELVVPMRVGERKVGVLDVHSLHEDAFAGDEAMVLETLAGQIAVAIENARVYQLEHLALKQLRELEESRRRFLSNMSRELRMPLNNIIGFARVILKGIDGPITDLQREDLTAIHESGQQLLALINDILDIAQIEAGAMELAMRPVDPAEIARSVIPTTNALLEGRPIKLRHEIPSSLPTVLADPFRLRQVLIKILSNAAKFTYEGEINLFAWPNGQEVLISVRDTGIGIPEEDQEKIFEMFQQLSQPGSQPHGTGLGLTFSKEIVAMHGGTIRLDSKEGEGTTFTIALPAMEAVEGNSTQRPAVSGDGQP